MAFCGEPVLHAPGARGGPVTVRRGLWSWYAEPREVVGAVRGVTEVGQLAHVGRVCEFVVQRLEVFLLAAARLAVPPPRCVVVEDAPPGIVLHVESSAFVSLSMTCGREKVTPPSCETVT